MSLQSAREDLARKAPDMPVYCDISLKAFAMVIPAAGDRNSSLKIEPDRLAALVNATGVDVCE